MMELDINFVLFNRKLKIFGFILCVWLLCV